METARKKIKAGGRGWIVNAVAAIGGTKLGIFDQQPSLDNKRMLDLEAAK